MSRVSSKFGARHYRARRLEVSELKWEGLRFLLLRNDALARTLRRRGSWEPHLVALMEAVLREGDVAIDVGANFGFHTVVMASCVGDSGAVHAFEPLRIVYQQLCANVFRNGFRNVYTYRCVVGESDGAVVAMNDIDFLQDNVNIGDTRVGSGGDVVETHTLDHFQFKGVKLIKMDVQGYELLALKGAKKLISEQRPIIFVEVEEHHLRAFGSSSKELIEYLLSTGYVLLRIKTEYPCDHVCVPVERATEIPDLISRVGWQVDVLTGTTVELTFDGPWKHKLYNRFSVS